MPSVEERRRRQASRAAARGERAALQQLVPGRRGRGGRVFALHVGSVTKVAPSGQGGSPDYIARIGQFDQKDADLETLVGRNPAEMKKIVDAVHDETGRKNGRVAIPVMSELPFELAGPAKRRIALALVDWFERRGYPAMAAVHGNGKVQPHVHVIATARPVRIEDERITVAAEGRRGAPTSFDRLFKDRAAVRGFRHQVAEIINAELKHMGGEADWHGGNFRDVGIARQPKKRVPQAAWHQRGQREIDPDQVAAAHERAARKRAEIDKKKAEKAARRRESTRRRAQAEAEARDAQAELRGARAALEEARAHERALRAALESGHTEIDRSRELAENQRYFLHRSLIEAGLTEEQIADYQLTDGAGAAEAWGYLRALRSTADKVMELEEAREALAAENKQLKHELNEVRQSQERQQQDRSVSKPRSRNRGDGGMEM